LSFLSCIWKNKNYLLFIAVATALVALFLPTTVLPDISNRSFYHLWESGHLLLFFLGCHAFHNFYPQPFNLTSAKKFGIFLCIAASCALTIEGLQSFFSGKSLEFSDIVGDMAGVLLYLSFRSYYQGANNFFIHGLALLLAGFVFWPVFSSFADEMLAKYQFPVLADFETPFEVSRFEGRTGSAMISGEQAYQGQHSLRLSFSPGPWSGMMLKHFPSNWQRYNQLCFAAYNPHSQPVTLHVRIHDGLHERGNKAYSDLYSRMCLLPAGHWTKVEIPLAMVYSAPSTRRMDLANIRGLGFFVEKEEQPLMLYLDNIRLE